MGHWIWGVFCLGVMIWYIVVTAVVGIKGGQDIKNMLRDLRKQD